MKKIVRFFFTSIVILFVACKKETPAQIDYPTTNVKLSPAALNFVQLPVGRYFIYKDSASGSTDSVSVTQSSNENLFHKGRVGSGCGWFCYDPGEPDYYYEKYSLTISSTSQEWFKGVASCDANYSSLAFAILGNPSMLVESNFNLYDAFWYPFTTYGSRQYTSIPILTIEGNTYAEVHHFFSTNGLQPTDINYLGTTHYWVKGIGIIKKEIRTYNSIKTSLLIRHG